MRHPRPPAALVGRRSVSSRASRNRAMRGLASDCQPAGASSAAASGSAAPSLGRLWSSLAVGLDHPVDKVVKPIWLGRGRGLPSNYLEVGRGQYATRAGRFTVPLSAKGRWGSGGVAALMAASAAPVVDGVRSGLLAAREGPPGGSHAEVHNRAAGQRARAHCPCREQHPERRTLR